MKALVKKPFLVSQLTARWISWRMPSKGKVVYLTFDDGPNKEVTPLILDILASHQIKATFFVLGKNVLQNPRIFQRILDEGHAVGNHTFSHLNGWKTDNKTYFEDVNKASQLIKSRLFRPPYGKIKPCQMVRLAKEYKIICWSLLTRDYDKEMSPGQCFENVKKNASPGDVIVFHDSEKASVNCLKSLPLSLAFLKEQGYTFCLPDNNFSI